MTLYKWREILFCGKKRSDAGRKVPDDFNHEWHFKLVFQKDKEQ